MTPPRAFDGFGKNNSSSSINHAASDRLRPTSGMLSEEMGLMDRLELAGVSVVVASRFFPWWACVLGKAGVTYLHKSSPWVELSDAYFARFNVVIRKIANLLDVVPHLRGVHTLFVDTRLLVGNSDTTALSRSDVKCVVVTSGFNSKPPTGFAGFEVPFNHVNALLRLTDFLSPPKRRVRSKRISFVTYGFGDASGKGFGAALKLWNGVVFYRQGIWEYRITYEQSSNYRELRNLVDSLERAAEKGLLNGTEIWMFTDNSVAEAAFFRGSSKSRELNHLVLRLRRLEMELGVRIMVVHVLGKRMILTGIDGVSRGGMNAGVMAGADMLSYVPLHLSLLQRSLSLRGWLKEWIGDGGLFLEASDWPRKHLNHGTYVWSPPPAAAPAALDGLGESIHKRPTSVHVVVVPRLLTALWRKQLGKLTDVMLTVPLGCPTWQADNLEPLILAISLPLSHSLPWRFRNTPVTQDVEQRLPQMWLSSFGDIGHTLRKLLRKARNFQRVKVCGVLSVMMMTQKMTCSRSSVRSVQKTSTRWWTTRTRKGSWRQGTVITLCVSSSVICVTFGIFNVVRREWG